MEKIYKTTVSLLDKKCKFKFESFDNFFETLRSEGFVSFNLIQIPAYRIITEQYLKELYDHVGSLICTIPSISNELPVPDFPNQLYIKFEYIKIGQKYYLSIDMYYDFVETKDYDEQYNEVTQRISDVHNQLRQVLSNNFSSNETGFII